MVSNATKDQKDEAETKVATEPELSVEDDLDQARKELEETESASEEDTQSDESSESDASPTGETKETLTTPPEPEHDLAWYRKAYKESTDEAMRLKAELDKAPPPPAPVIDSQDKVALTPEQLYIKQKQDEEINIAFAETVTAYPQVKDPEEYKKFTAMANTFGRTILDAEGRLATPKELYAKTAIALGWTDDSAEKLGAALKDGASSPRVSSGGASAPQTSKVTDAMIRANRRWYPAKTDAEIREELEPHVQA